MEDLNFRNNPPYLDDVSFILNHMKPHSSLKAMLHLMLPIKTAESIEVDYSNGVAWRGHVVKYKYLSIKNIRTMVESRVEKKDKFLPCLGLSAPLVKPIKTGSGYFFFGSDCLYGLPLIFTKNIIDFNSIARISSIVHGSARIKNKKDYLKSEFKINNITAVSAGEHLEVFF